MHQKASEILGRTINGIIIREHNKLGIYSSQLFLLFDDDTSYEFYSDCTINACGSLNKGARFDDLIKHPNKQMKILLQTSLHNTAENNLQRNNT